MNMIRERLTFHEFFAGGGMARAGLGEEWSCGFANDFDAMKVATYRANWGDDIRLEDVAKLTTADLPGAVDLAWASFPCQDLSLAGGYRGLGHRSAAAPTRSGTFWPFWSLMRDLAKEGRAPRTIVLENVHGVLTSHEGRDFAAICSALSGSNYRFGAVAINARLFVPQSRPRVFFIAVRGGESVADHLLSDGPSPQWHPTALIAAYGKLSAEARKKWMWWNIQIPNARNTIFADVIEDEPAGVHWHTRAETRRLLAMMSPINKAKVAAAKKAGTRVVGGLYRRTRPNGDGERIQRAEVRFDDVAGCLRTPAGGSSRQSILVVEGENVRSRLLSPREAARLMGLDDEYKLPANYNDAYHLVGDGVVAPVVRHIAATLLEPILVGDRRPSLMAAE